MLRISCALALLVACQATDVDWSYANSAAGITSCTNANRCGPADWSKKYPKCGGTGDQSPIEAPMVSNGGYRLPGSSIEDLTFTTVSTQCTKFNRDWNAHGMAVDVATDCAGSYSLTYGQSLPKATFKLKQFNFHSPSEHTVDGAYYPLETHFVFQDASTPAKTLIIAVFATANKGSTFETGCIAAASKPKAEQTLACQQAYFFDALLHNYNNGAKTLTDTEFEAELKAATGDKISYATSVSSLKSPQSVDAFKYFMPDMSADGSNHFFTYTGSYTTPPCNTGVTWILNPTVIEVYYTSLNTYRNYASLWPSPNQLKTSPAAELTAPKDAGVNYDWTATKGYNNRPVQAMGTRRFSYVGTLPPWDSSKSSSGLGASSATSLESSQSSSNSAESDSGSGSYASSGSNASGSSGFNMAVWKWTTLLTICGCCLLGACIAAFCKKPAPKKKKAPPPAPAPDPVVEEPLLPPLMPVTTAVPVTTSYAMPATYAMPQQAYAMPATTAMAAPAYSAYGGSVV